MYTDNRGIKVPDERIEGFLKTIGKTEEEVKAFLGEERMNVPGWFYYFLEMMNVYEGWYRPEEFK
jgi:hypothetical protein